mmetsp:Transcript_38536/g.46580  ORF Transcript_38536/g.46580 Transcript_38536/m.46580 type:complete len:351 (-) Transcript_38536:108-1160(-)|eukprot:CAMPEP_0197846932 /NCGR_PEP_ID=MMETSP1438-20131217/4726_1 /TAXON_ID=1461541 /ORGANISM="Pterosperma sp., Strain CCMP1384" /LENGTH=350 /DNA_ID=CAMNT_0043458723 /DNA_START=191 /DNA_END=1243 /DNA_ORIENTATION=-
MGVYLSQPITAKESEDGSGRNCKYGLSSMQGWRRSMEDAHVARPDHHGEVSMFAVFDGHGGTEVSKFCAEHMPRELLTMREYASNDYGGSLTKSFHQMDDMIRHPKYREDLKRLKGKEDEDEETPEIIQKVLQLKKLIVENAGQGQGGGGGGPGPSQPQAQIAEQAESEIHAGCTAVVCLLSPTQIIVANAGDSRAVLCRGGKAVPLSFDHKPKDKIEEDRIKAAGGWVTSCNDQHRVNGNLNLSRAIGDLKYKSNPDLQAKDQIITAEPDIITQQRQSSDEFIILACDGVWDVMTNQACVDFVKQRLDAGGYGNLSKITEELLDRCLSVDPKETNNLGCDNMTAIIVKL